ncbi:hypothetical protein B5S28_g951 [[Candida] boidinii]|uniref:Unnamed protein product n=1 Tax=Candida boidinii TaxID=5477 RepID=A0ACB5TSR5_CANBO|nr:hypothetical protein B5S28_g951 [[Candida] boidinii]OWB62995.1 hypothetical protein B5S29_g3948 [[Candida] boidinii]OWB79260.1 hypothetical protein B5S32_g3475 [[Candida] boidinii]GME91249.1 unnamed protein product [[Candida] boidinii]GME94528.1 unnamed protein product [[Candida] boidinii]
MSQFSPEDQNSITNLDQDLQNSRLNKYNDPELQKDIKNWIFNIVLNNDDDNNNNNILDINKQDDLMNILKDGTVLCQLINKVYGLNSIKFKKSGLAFVQMENIEKFLNFIKFKGVPEDELFQTIDLYESKDPYQIMMTIRSLSRTINKEFPQYPLIGPKISTKHKRPPVPPKPKQFQSATSKSNNSWSTLEYGYMGGSNQAKESVVFGSSHSIIRKGT